MDFSGLDTFDSTQSGLDSLIGVDKQNLMSAAQYKTTELREKGNALLETGVPAELLSGVAFKASGVTLEGITNTLNTLPSTISNATDSITNAVSSGIQTVSDTATSVADSVQSLYNTAVDTIGNAYNSILPTAQRLAGETNSEFGISDTEAMELLNGGRFNSLYSEASGSVRLTAPTESIEMTNMANVVDNVGTSTTTFTEGSSEAIGEAAGEAIGESAVETGVSVGLETAGAALDATGILAPIGVLIGLAGIGAGAYSLVSGFESLFKKAHDNVTSQIPNFAQPNFQAS